LYDGVTEGDFSQLPQAMVEGMLKQTDEVRNRLLITFRKLIERRDEHRRHLVEMGLLKRDMDLSAVNQDPTACGIDGSYAIDKLIATDVIAAAGVAVEGLTPPTEKRYWPEPRHESVVLPIHHSDATQVVLAALMIFMELELASKAPHDVVFIDGSLASPLIYLNKAIYELQNVSEDLGRLLASKLNSALESYAEILDSRRTDKIFVGVPKYTSKKDISLGILNQIGYEDRGFLSQIMNSGEFIGPMPMQMQDASWRIPRIPVHLEKKADEICNAIRDIYVTYYRPRLHFPTLRLEMSKSVATDSQRLAILFECLRAQCAPPGILEPFPLYLADRMVKHLGKALPAIRRAATQEMMIQWGDDTSDMYLALHGYRTDTGK
jgi:hypothetical protein